VARNRKRAKERRARRPQPVVSARTERDEAPDPIRHAAPDVELAEAQMALGRPDLVAEPEYGDQDEAEAELTEEEEALEPDLADDRGGGGARGSAVGDGATEAAEAPHPIERPRARNRLINFLQGSWHELQRVQWPDRRQVVQATGVVIGFVIVAGVYLGVADTVATKLVNFILK
jgi:preprotein translocase subunit SecE